MNFSQRLSDFKNLVRGAFLNKIEIYKIFCNIKKTENLLLLAKDFLFFSRTQDDSNVRPAV
jgi:hypothetical protein